MAITAELADLIGAKIYEYQSVPDEQHYDIWRLIADNDVLPLMNDWGGCYAINRAGEIVSFSWDDHRNVTVEDDARIKNIALAQGSIVYPELKSLIPERPPEAKTCETCNGTGIPPHGDKVPGLVCYCGGLGCVP